MKTEKQRLIYFYLEVFLMILAVGLLILNFYQMKKEEFKCVRDPKQYLIEHFEKVTNGNISCNCMTDSPDAFVVGKRRGYQIWFGSGVRPGTEPLPDIFEVNTKLVNYTKNP